MFDALKLYWELLDVRYRWAAALTFFSTLSIQDWGFIIGTVISAFFTVKTYYAKRREERLLIEEERKRTALFEQYIKGISERPDDEVSASVQVIKKTLSEVSEI